MFPDTMAGWSGVVGADPDGILYVNVNEIPWFYQLIQRGNGWEDRYLRASCFIGLIAGLLRTGPV